MASHLITFSLTLSVTLQPSPGMASHLITFTLTRSVTIIAFALTLSVTIIAFALTLSVTIIAFALTWSVAIRFRSADSMLYSRWRCWLHGCVLFLQENLALRALSLSHNNFREKGGEILGSGIGNNAFRFSLSFTLLQSFVVATCRTRCVPTLSLTMIILVGS